MIANEVLDHADRTNRQLWDIVFDSPFPGEVVTHKTILVAAYIDLALEHQSAITFLIRNHHTGSAMALVRPVFEMLYRGTWILGCASDSQAEMARRERLVWPDTSTLVEQADKAYGDTDGFLQTIKKRSWKVMNSYTHSGALQVGSRFTGNDLHPSYDNDDRVLAVEGTMIAAGLLAVPFLRFHERTEQADRVEALLMQFM